MGTWTFYAALGARVRDRKFKYLRQVKTKSPPSAIELKMFFWNFGSAIRDDSQISTQFHNLIQGVSRKQHSMLK
jgi:hypothetical protein